MSLGIVILAAGRGTRFNSDNPKVLFELAGKPLLDYVLSAVADFDAKLYIVCGYKAELVKKSFEHKDITWVNQEELNGTGHAVMQVLPHLDSNIDRLLVLNGDGPLISKNTIKKLVTETEINSIGLVTALLKDPTGYGRIIHNHNRICAIIEESEASIEQKEIDEVNGGIYLFPLEPLRQWLDSLSSHNNQQEYFLTDVIYHAYHDGVDISAVHINSKEELLGVNSFYQLAELEKIIQSRQARKLQEQGVYIVDHTRFDLRGELYCGKDVKIDINNLFLGANKIGDGCEIGANCVLKNVEIGKNVKILPFCHLENTKISDDCVVGPFSRLRPGTELAKEVHIGNFVEIKKSKIDQRSKVGHLTYVGDSEIGKNVNVGAGTITCNYDGKNKNKTIIKDSAFIGSNVSLVAPVEIGEGATIGAGSVISKDAPKDKLTLERSQQVTVESWERKK